MVSEQAHQFPQLIDEEEWFNLHGLRQGTTTNNSSNNNSNHDDQNSSAHDRELSDRIANEASYRQTVSDRIFAQEDEINDNDSKTRRQLMIQAWKQQPILVHCQSDNHTNETQTETITVNLGDLASRSDTVFVMASNNHLYSNNDNDDDENTTTNNANTKQLELSLLEYSKQSVQAFFEALLLPTNKNENDHIIPPEYVIDCCRLAHYLQCRELLDSIVANYLLTNIDSDNCRFLCKLADELSLPTLWEASVNHMLSSLDKFNTTSSSTETGLWEDLSPTLKAEIQALRGILKSSNTSKVYFSTYHEYLALLAEQLQYYRERLQDAQDSQTTRLETETSLQAQLTTLKQEKASLGSWSYGSKRLDNAIHNLQQQLEGLQKGSDYAARKIQNQQDRVHTLREIWKEQKKVFGGGIDSSGTEHHDLGNLLRFEIQH